MDESIPGGDPGVPELMANRAKAIRGEKILRWGLRGAVLFLLLAVIFLLAIVYQNRNLPDLLDAQRQQFVDCTDKPAKAAGCEKPVVSEKEVQKSKEAFEAVPGATGPKGDTGASGAPGRPGSDATIEQVILAVQKLLPQALQESCGGSCKGPEGDASTQPGPKGETGSSGSQGAAGSKGDIGPDGPQGPKGETGSAGPAGDPGPATYPESITCDGTTGVFTFSGDRVYRVDGMCATVILP